MKTILENIGLVGLSLVLSGCELDPPPDKSVEVFAVPAQQVEGARFRIERHGKFKAGYQNNEREILVIVDTETKRTYLGITGVGVAELRTDSQISTDSSGSVSVDTETVEE